ncbi:MAG TPA: sugar diacid recognition domain-containing protein [Mycobacterium sp.]|jgi:carbohydrate diacid regulator|nr:sugar diacid recognition domain-containing protein [Mycobacterium sp.]
MDQFVLTPELASEIADETTRILGHNVLITDENARVIGSGDISRVGSIHEASVSVLETGDAASHDAEEAAALSGVLPGITMPIVLDGAVIGTVGITGSPARVVRLGRLVQRQTEILLRESLFQRTRLLRENRLTQLVRDIILFDPGLVDEQIIRASGVDLGYDLTQPRVAIVFEVQPGPLSYPSSVRVIGEIFGARTDIVAELAAGRYIVLKHLSPDDAEHVRERARRAAELLRYRHGIIAHVGIGEAGSGVAALAASCADATAALRLGPDRVGTGIEILEIANLRVRQLLSSTSGRARSRFTSSQLALLARENDFDGLCDTLVAWCESGFNLVLTARRLSIHRNTVIYRLDKIARTTTRDVREPGVAIALYLACLIGDHRT